MGNRQGVFGVSRSWFYLTLWRGTPPEFTTSVDAQIEDASSAVAHIKMEDGMNTDISTTASLSTYIRSRESIGTDIITTTEVVWYVS